MEWQDESSVNFRCVKCRNTTAIVRKVNLAKGILPELLTRGSGRYRFMTCSLCGYTEIYDLAIYEKNTATVVEEEARGLAPET